MIDPSGNMNKIEVFGKLQKSSKIFRKSDGDFMRIS